MGKEEDLNDFEGSMVPDVMVWVIQKMLIFWDFHTQPSRVYRERSKEKENIQ